MDWVLRQNQDLYVDRVGDLHQNQCKDNGLVLGVQCDDGEPIMEVWDTPEDTDEDQ